MFGITAFSQTPFAAVGPALLLASASIDAVGAVSAESQAFIKTSATISSDSAADCFAIRYGVGGATIVGESDFAVETQGVKSVAGQISASSSASSSAFRYKIGASVLAAESSFECYAIRYGVGGATIVGESDFIFAATRYAIGDADLVAVSAVESKTNIIANNQALIEGGSGLNASVLYTARGVSILNASSAIIISARKKWENEPDTAETWEKISDTPENWTPV
jgi:hypothetical protein